MMKRILLACIAFAVSGCTVTRKTTKSPAGQADAQPNVVYACTASHGLWCSQDRGSTWKFMKVPHFRVSHVKVDPANPEVIYATTFGGGTWRGYYLPE